MADDTLRSVQVQRLELGRYVVRNVRGGEITIGEGQNDDFTPVELLLAAIGGCTGIDVDYITGRRAQPDTFAITVTGDKVRSAENGNHLENLTVTFDVRVPEGDAGDLAREALPKAVERSHDRLCTVSRTVELGMPITSKIAAD
jgi:putative redox protein